MFDMDIPVTEEGLMVYEDSEIVWFDNSDVSGWRDNLKDKDLEYFTCAMEIFDNNEVLALRNMYAKRYPRLPLDKPIFLKDIYEPWVVIEDECNTEG